MKQLEIVFRSGAVIRVDATEVSVTTGQLEGDLRKIAWTTPDGAKRRLLRAQLDRIDALVEIE
jgi:hypothetical protein